MSVLAKRLKEARIRADLSQERLGLEAGLDAMSASARMNRYEKGNRVPSLELVERIAEVLKLPAAYFYAGDDETAELLIAFHRLSKAGRSRVMSAIREE
ncbi:helix-turn-helix domain-containing protein [Pseudomonas sp. S2_E01]